jgi:hypothetical protein
VVGGLIQEQNVRSTHQRLRHVEANAPATGEFGDPAIFLTRGEAKAIQQSCGAGIGLIASYMLELLMKMSKGQSITGYLGFG